MKIIDRYVLLYLRLLDKPFGYREIMNSYGVSANNAKVILSRMLKAGMAKRTGRDEYVLLDPLSYLVKGSFGRDVVSFMEKVYGKEYYFTGPSALSFYGLASSPDYYITVMDKAPAEVYSRSVGIEMKILEREVRRENCIRDVFEGKEASIAKLPVALSETMLLDKSIVQFYAIPAVGEYLERGFKVKNLLDAAKEAGMLPLMEKVLKTYSENGMKISIVPKIKVTAEEKAFILGGINV